MTDLIGKHVLVRMRHENGKWMTCFGGRVRGVYPMAGDYFVVLLELRSGYGYRMSNTTVPEGTVSTVSTKSQDIAIVACGDQA
jgi:hypothetical protein